MSVDAMIRKYREKIVEKLYEELGYKLEKETFLSDENLDVIILTYVRKREVEE